MLASQLNLLPAITQITVSSVKLSFLRRLLAITVHPVTVQSLKTPQYIPSQYSHSQHRNASRHSTVTHTTPQYIPSQYSHSHNTAMHPVTVQSLTTPQYIPSQYSHSQHRNTSRHSTVTHNTAAQSIRPHVIFIPYLLKINH